MAPSVFISYTHADAGLANALVAALQTEGVAVWIDRVELKVGESIVQRVADVIQQVDFVVPLISRASQDSRWVRRELSLAVTGELTGAMRGVRVLPVRVAGADLPNLLRDRLYADLPDKERASVAVCAHVLAEDIRRHLGPPDRDLGRLLAEPRITALREQGSHDGTAFSTQIERRAGAIRWYTAGEDGRVWSRHPFDPSDDRVIYRHRDAIRCICLVRGAPRAQLVGGTMNGQVFIIDAESGSELAAYQPCDRTIWCVESFYSQGRTLVAIAGADWVVRFHEIFSGKSFLPDFHRADVAVGAITRVDFDRPSFILGGTSVNMARPGGVAYVIDQVSGELWAKAYPADAGPCWAVAGYRQGGTNYAVTTGGTGRLRGWDLDVGDLISTSESYNIPGLTSLRLLDFRGEIVAAVGDSAEGGRIRLLRLEGGPPLDTQHAHEGFVHSLDAVRDGNGYLMTSAGDEGGVGIYRVQ